MPCNRLETACSLGAEVDKAAHARCHRCCQHRTRAAQVHCLYQPPLQLCAAGHAVRRQVEDQRGSLEVSRQCCGGERCGLGDGK